MMFGARDKATQPVAAEGITLFLILYLCFGTAAWFVASLFLPVPTGWIFDNVWLIWLVHAAASVYCGGFDRLHAAVWRCLVLVASLLIVVEFFNHVLPWGQLSLWVATKVTDAFPSLADFLREHPLPGLPTQTTVIAAIFTVLLVLDIGLVQGRILRLRSFRTNALLVAIALFLSLAANIAAMATMPLPPTLPASPEIDVLTPARIVPTWKELPLYAIARSSPFPPSGLVLYFLATPMLIVAPWLHGDLWRSGRFWPFWALLCFSLCCTWIGLTWLGAQVPEEAIMNWSLALSVWYFAFFLVLPVAVNLITASKQRNRAR